MVASLALPTFISGPKDALATVDVYKVKSDQVVNSISSILKSYDPKLAQSLGGRNLLDIKSIVSNALGETDLTRNQQALLTRVMNVSPEISSAIKSIDNALKGEITSLFNAGLTQGTVFINNTLSSVGAEGLINAKDVNTLLKVATNGTSSLLVRDIAGQVNLYSAVIKKCLQLDIGDTAKSILSVIADRQILNLLVRELTPTVLKKSSVRDLRSLGQSVRSGSVLSTYPAIISDFGRLYRFGQLQNESDYVQIYQDILEAYTAIHPDWNSYTRITDVGPETCINIEPLIGGSRTFNAVIQAGAMQSSVQNEKAYLLAPKLKKIDVHNSLRIQYPRIALSFRHTTTRIKDPRIL